MNNLFVNRFGWLETGADTFWTWMAPMAWQLTLLVAILLILSWLLRNRCSARFRYALWLIVPLRLVLPPTLAMATSWGWWFLPPQEAPTQEAIAREASAQVAEPDQSFVLDPQPAPIPHTNRPDFEISFDEPEQSPPAVESIGPLNIAFPHAQTHEQETLENSSSGVVSKESDSLPTQAELIVASPPEVNIKTTDSRPFRRIQIVVFLVWLMGFMILTMRLGRGWLQMRRLMRGSRLAPDSIASIADQCSHLVQLDRRITVFESSKISSPMLVGILRPVILVPERIGQYLDKDELQTVIVHEMHHARRRDSIVNFITQVLAAVYWFHPAVWISVWQTRRLRELACDEATVQSLTGSRKAYASGLVKIAEMISNQPPVSSLGFVERKREMKSRVTKILDSRLRAGRGLSVSGLAIIGVLALVLIPGAGRPSTAGNNSDRQKVESSTNPDLPNGNEISEPVEQGEDTTSTANIQSTAEASTGLRPPLAAQDEKFSMIEGKVVDASGAPVAGARVRLNAYLLKQGRLPDLPEVRTDSTGHFTLKFEKELLQSDQLSLRGIVVSHPEKGIGWTSSLKFNRLRMPLREIQNPLQESGKLEIEESIQLLPTQTFSGILRDTNGQPMPGVQLWPHTLTSKPFFEIRGGVNPADPTSIPVEGELFSEFMATTDEKGEFRIPGLPKDGTYTAKIQLSDSAEILLYWPLNHAVDISLPTSQPLRGEFNSEASAEELATIQFRFNSVEPSLTPAKEYGIRMNSTVALDATGSFETQLAPGKYSAHSSRHGKNSPWYVDRYPREIDITAGPESFDFEIKRGDLVHGKVVDLETRDAVPNVRLLILSESESYAQTTFGETTTNDQGEYLAFVPQGRFAIGTITPPQGYLEESLGRMTGDNPGGASEPIEMPDYKLRKGIDVHVRVVDNDGRPVAGASISRYQAIGEFASRFAYLNSTKTDAEGRTILHTVDPRELLGLEVTEGKRMSKGRIFYDPADIDGEITIQISENYGFYLTGRVENAQGNPVEAFHAELEQFFSTVSKQQTMRGGVSFRISAPYRVDEEHRFRIGPLSSSSRYRLVIQADGFEENQTPQARGEVGGTHDFGVIQLRSTAGAVAGTLVDSTGQPMKGVHVINSGDAKTKLATRTNERGQFVLEGLTAGSVALLFENSGEYFGVQTATGESNLRIRWGETGLDQARPLSEQQRQALAKTMLLRIRQLPDEQFAGVSESLIASMAEIDPELALEWAASTTREEVRLHATAVAAKNSPQQYGNELLTLLRTSSAHSVFQIVRDVAEQLINTNPDLAIQLVEQLSQTARRDSSDFRAVYLAQAGSLLLQLRQSEAGQRLFDEACVAFEGISDGERIRYVRLAVAKQIAAFEPQRALDLLEPIEPERTRRFVQVQLVPFLAKANRKLAIEVLGDADADGRLQLAYDLASVDLDLALQLLEQAQPRISDVSRMNGLMWLAAAVSESRPQQAEELIDRALAISLSESSDFDSRANYGYESPFAAQTAFIGAQIGYSDRASLVARVIASRRPSNRMSGFVTSERANIQMIAYLALVDPAAARWLMEPLESKITEPGLIQRYNIKPDTWILAWILSDPEKAIEKFEQQLQWDLAQDGAITRGSSSFRLAQYLSLDDETFHHRLLDLIGIWYPGQDF